MSHKRIVYAVYGNDQQFDNTFIKRCENIVYVAFGETSTAIFFKFDGEDADIYLSDYLSLLCPSKPLKVKRLEKLY